MSPEAAGQAQSRVVTVSIARRWEDVYAFASLPERMHRWAQGLGSSLRRDGETWWVDTPGGAARVRFSAPNALGVIDHEVTLPDGTVVEVPLRVVAAGAGCTVELTVLRRPGMADADFERDAASVERDLAALKALMER
jgi:hypothetical protein